MHNYRGFICGDNGKLSHCRIGFQLFDIGLAHVAEDVSFANDVAQGEDIFLF